MNMNRIITTVLFAGVGLAVLMQPQIVSAARLSEEAPASAPALSAPGGQSGGVSQKGQPEKVQADAKAVVAPATETGEDKGAAQEIKAKKKSAPVGKPLRKKVRKAPPAAKRETPVSGEPSVAGRAGDYVTIDFDNVDIAVFIKTIGEMTGKNFVMDNQVKGNVTIYSPRKITLAEAYKVFESVLEVHGYTAIPSGDVVKIVPAKDAKEKSVETRLDLESLSPTDRVVTQIVSLKYANPDDIKRILDPLIARSSIVLSYPPSGMLVITDTQSNIRRLAKIITSLDIPGSGEQVTVLPLKNAGAVEAAKALTSIFQADQAAQRRSAAQSVKVIPDERTNTIIVVATEFYTNRVKQLLELLDREVPRGDSTMHTYRLQNANAEELAKVLVSLSQKEGAKTAGEKTAAVVVSKNTQIIADKATNTLVITAARDDYRVLEDVIKSLDVARAMVYLEALIMEVSVNKSFKLGVEWRGMAKTANSTGIFAGSGGLSSQTSPGEYSIFTTPTYDSTSGTTAASFPSGFSLGVVSSGITIGGVTFPSIGAALQAIQQDQDIHILSTPQILTLDNEDAEVRVGSNIPYVTRQDTSSSTVAYSTYEYKDVGMTLKVTPHINEDGFVRMKISQEMTSLVSQTQSVSSSTSVIAPTTLKRSANTTVIVKDNTTVVIGGIIGDSSTKTNYGVPWLSKIPVLGYLFKSKSDVREQTNLFVFLTPRIVRTQKEAAAIQQEKRGHLDEVRDGVVKLHENNQKDTR